MLRVDIFIKILAKKLQLEREVLPAQLTSSVHLTDSLYLPYQEAHEIAIHLNHLKEQE